MGVMQCVNVVISNNTQAPLYLTNWSFNWGHFNILPPMTIPAGSEDCFEAWGGCFNGISLHVRYCIIPMGLGGVYRIGIKVEYDDNLAYFVDTFEDESDKEAIHLYEVTTDIHVIDRTITYYVTVKHKT